MASKEECYEPDCRWLITKRLWFVIFSFIYDGVISYIKNLYVMNKDRLFHYFYNNHGFLKVFNILTYLSIITLISLNSMTSNQIWLNCILYLSKQHVNFFWMHHMDKLRFAFDAQHNRMHFGTDSNNPVDHVKCCILFFIWNGHFKTN